MFIMRIAGHVTILAAVAAALTGCATPKGDTAAARRADAQAMRTQVIETFYRRMPQMKGELEKAPGYGVFSGFSTQTIFVSSGNGYGIIRDNSTGHDTYMRVLKLGGGLGVGAQDIRGVVIFHDRAKMQDMLANGWNAQARADAAAKIDDSGDSGNIAITLPGMTIYRFTQNGVMLGGAVEGTKVWPDEDLN